MPTYKFALVNGKRTKPSPKLRGIHEYCGSEMTSVCPRERARHWRHLRKRTCDQWWENQTEWHVEWKNHFPEEWQEVVHVDENTGEKHIADVKTPAGLVVEIQHSNIDAQERQSRESFYGDMVWIVDGNQNETSNAYFTMHITLDSVDQNPFQYQIKWYGPNRFFPRWTPTRIPVYVDFGSSNLWRIVSFDQETRVGKVFQIPKEKFVELCQSDEPFSALNGDYQFAVEFVRVWVRYDIPDVGTDDN